MKIVGYYVTKGEKPCTFKNVTGSYRSGILVPAKREEPAAFFNKIRDARRAVRRSESAAKLVVGSIVEEWAKSHSPSYFDGTPFEILPLGKQLADLPKLARPNKQQ